MRVVIAGESVAERDRCRQTVLRLGHECTGSDSVAPEQLRLRLTREPSAELVLVTVSDKPAEWEALQYAVGQGRAPVLAVGPASEDWKDFAQKHGAQAYLEESQLREYLLNTTVRSPGSANGDSRRGRAIGVFGMQPGVGVTTIAAGLAFTLAGKDRRVSLLEFGNSTPDLALLLDLNPPHSIAELIRESVRLDASMLRNAAARADGVDILAYAPETLENQPLTVRAVEDFLVLARSTYEWSIFDLGHGLNETQVHAISHCDLAVIATRLDVPGVRLTRAVIRHLKTLQIPDEKIVVAVNFFGQSGQMAWRKFEEALRSPVAVWLPEDSASMNKAVNEGKPITQATRSKLTRELAKLADVLQQKVTVTRP